MVVAADRAMTVPATIVYGPTAADVDPRRAARRRRTLELGLAWGVPLVLGVLWQVAASAEAVDTRFFPAPSSIWDAARQASSDGILWSNLWITSRRMLLGFAFGATTGILVGLAMGMLRLLRVALEPLLSALYTVPKLALLPLFLLIFGIGETPRIWLIAVTVFFFMWISTMEAVVAVPEGGREALASFGATRWQLFRHVLGPASLPQIFVAMRLSAGVAVLVTVGLEFVQADDGIGAMTWKSWSLFLAPRMYVGIVAIALLGLVFSMAVTALGRALTPWAPRQKVVGRL